MKEKFFDMAMRKKLYMDLGSLQEDLDEWLGYYNHERRARRIRSNQYDRYWGVIVFFMVI